MYEISQFARLRKSKDLSPVIIELPNGKFKLTTIIPVELTKIIKSGFTTTRDSITFETEQKAIDALLRLGITRFQLNDCSWYEIKT